MPVQQFVEVLENSVELFKCVLSRVVDKKKLISEQLSITLFISSRR